MLRRPVQCSTPTSPASTPQRPTDAGSRASARAAGLLLALVASLAGPSGVEAQKDPAYGRFYIGGVYSYESTDAELQRGNVRTRQFVNGVLQGDTIQRDDPGQVNSRVDSELTIQQYGMAVEWTSPPLASLTDRLTMDLRFGAGYADLTNTLTLRATGAETKFEANGLYLGGGGTLNLSGLPGDLILSVGGDAEGSPFRYDAKRRPPLAPSFQTIRGFAQEPVREDPKVSYVRWRVAMTGSKNFDFDATWLRRVTVRAGAGWEDISYTLENQVTRQGVQGVTVVQTGETQRANSGPYGTVGASAEFRKWVTAHTDFRFSDDAWSVTLRALFGF